MSDLSARDIKRKKNKQVILNYLERFINKNGYSPSVREIAAAVGFRSTSTVHSYLNELQEENLIVYADGKRRAISLSEDVIAPKSKVEANAETTKFGLDSESNDSTMSWPLLGLVTAGQPILAQENIEYNIAIDNKLFPRGNEDSFILRVRGESMIDAGINNGDLIIVSPTQSAELNQIVVALIGDEATVKRFSYIDGEPYLLPENQNFEAIPFNTEDCSIIGKVVGLIRTRI